MSESRRRGCEYSDGNSVNRNGIEPFNMDMGSLFSLMEIVRNI